MPARWVIWSLRLGQESFLNCIEREKLLLRSLQPLTMAQFAFAVVQSQSDSTSVGSILVRTDHPAVLDHDHCLHHWEADALDPHNALCGALWAHSVSMALGIHSFRTHEESLTQKFFNESFSLHSSMAFRKLPF